MLFVTDL